MYNFKSDKTMKQINSNITPQVVGVCGKLVVFELQKGEYAFASKRVANDVLSGSKDVFYTEGMPIRLPSHLRNGYNDECMVYLATPNIW